MSLKFENRSAFIFVKPTTVPNSENKIPFPETFCKLKFSVKHPKRSNRSN